MKLLLTGDKSLITDLVAHQAPVRERYSPDYVNPIFDQVFANILSPETTEPAREPAMADVRKPTAAARPIGVYFHYEKVPIRFSDGKYEAENELLTQLREYVIARAESSDDRFLITCLHEDLQKVHGFFYSRRHPDRVGLVDLTPERVLAGPMAQLTEPVRETERRFIMIRESIEREGITASRLPLYFATRGLLKANGFVLAGARALDRVHARVSRFWDKSARRGTYRKKTLEELGARCQFILIPEPAKFKDAILAGTKAVPLEPTARRMPNEAVSSIGATIEARLRARSREA